MLYIVFGLNREHFSDLFFYINIYQIIILTQYMPLKVRKNCFLIQFARPLLGEFKYGQNLNTVKVFIKNAN